MIKVGITCLSPRWQKATIVVAIAGVVREAK